MGCYINPPDMGKIAWLRTHGEPSLNAGPITETEVPVCLVDNGDFTAAGVAYDEEEKRRFLGPNDLRPKLWFQVSRVDARTVSDLAQYEAYLNAGTR